MSKGYRATGSIGKPASTQGTPAHQRRGSRTALHKNNCAAGLNRVQPSGRHARYCHPPALLQRTRRVFNVLPISSAIERHPGPNGMEEKRRHPRTDTEEPAFVSSGGSVMRCVLRNISLEGAAIDVENAAFVPQRFRLVMVNDSSIVHECQVAWIQKNRIGLTFVDLK
jgi:hypothetical protein